MASKCNICGMMIPMISHLGFIVRHCRGTVVRRYGQRRKHSFWFWFPHGNIAVSDSRREGRGSVDNTVFENVLLAFSILPGWLLPAIAAAAARVPHPSQLQEGVRRTHTEI
jgi:hypothetical protein